VTLRPGCPIVVAPTFHLPIDWSQRVLLGSGVERENGGFVPRPPWRAPDDRERSLLFPEPTLPLPRQSLEDCLCLFQLPQHLRSAWWRLLEQAEQTGNTHLQGFDAFVAEVASFLAFKDVSVPEAAAFDLLVSKPGLRSLSLTGPSRGLACNLAGAGSLPVTEEAGCPRLWGGINLGDEPTALLFINLLVRDLRAVVEKFPQPSSTGTIAELTERFFTMCPDYPPVRLGIEPGEGFRLPGGGLLVDGCTLEKQEPDVLLLVRHGSESS
jgi:hypothetical protein